MIFNWYNNLLIFIVKWIKLWFVFIFIEKIKLIILIGVVMLKIFRDGY